MDTIIRTVSNLLGLVDEALSLLGALGLPASVIGAYVAGVVVSWWCTQYVKRRIDWAGRKAVGLGFVFAFLPAITMGWGHGWVTFWAAVTAGASATASYKLLVTLARHRWEWIRNLSGDNNRENA